MSNIESEVERIMSEPWLYSGLPTRSPASLRLSAWTNFSLGVWSTWSIFSSPTGFWVRRIEWARSLDAIRVIGEAPSTFGAEAPLPKLLAVDLLDRAAELVSNSPPPERAGITIDGVARRLLLQGPTGTTRTLAWQAGAHGCMRLDVWLEEASVALDNLLTQSSAREFNGAA